MALFNNLSYDSVNYDNFFLNEVTGDDTNNGTTPNLAVATMEGLIAAIEAASTTAPNGIRAYIRKHKFYNEAISTVRSKAVEFIFVGGSIIDGSGTNYITFGVNGDVVWYATFHNYNIKYIDFASLNFGRTYNYCGFVDCIKFMYHNSNIASKMNYCYFKNCSDFDNYRGAGYFESCVFYGCSGRIPGGTNNRIDYAKNCIMVLSNAAVRSVVAFDYNCIVGDFGDKNLSEWQALGYNLNGIGSDLTTYPKFNDPTNNVYTVSSASPCLYKGEYGEHIGIGEAFYLTASSIWENKYDYSNINLVNSKLVRDDDNSDGFVETIQLSLGSIRNISKFNIAANLLFDGDDLQKTCDVQTEAYTTYDSTYEYTAGSTVTYSGLKYRSLVDDNLANTPTGADSTEWELKTWVTGTSYASGRIMYYDVNSKWYKSNTATTAGSWVSGEWDEVSPADYLDFKMKFGRTAAECEAADWTEFNFNDFAKTDSAGLGTQNDDFDASTAEFIKFNYYKVRIEAKTVI